MAHGRWDPICEHRRFWASESDVIPEMQLFLAARRDPEGYFCGLRCVKIRSWMSALPTMIVDRQNEPSGKIRSDQRYGNRPFRNSFLPDGTPSEAMRGSLYASQDRATPVQV